MHILVKSPYRVSFFGGGTDYHTWYEKFGGDVLSTTIDQYCNLVIRKFPEHFKAKYRIVWRELENEVAIDDIKHPIVREGLRFYQMKEGVSLFHEGDLPAMAGLASSSAFACGFIKGIRYLQGENLDSYSLAKEAIHLERVILRENVGIQDQIASAYGGFNHITIDRDGDFKVRKINGHEDSLNRLQDRLVLFFTGITRSASSIAKKQIDNSLNKEKELSAMQQMVHEAVSILESKNGSLDDFGKLLHETWLLKRSLTNQISNEDIDNTYDAAMNAGALGGKLLGAGGGGCLLFFVKEGEKQKLVDTLSHLHYIDFKFENKGSKVYNVSSIGT